MGWRIRSGAFREQGNRQRDNVNGTMQKEIDKTSNLGYAENQHHEM